ncbi:MAG: SAM-dependent methyltransferase [Thermoanaerobaculia bacterium]
MREPEQRLRARLATGPTPFHDFMEEALYGEGGYYSSAELRIGPEGDFVTGSSLSPLFGRATARLLSRLDEALGDRATLLEAGCGSGAHLAAVASATAGDRRLVGWDRVGRALAPGIEGVADLDGIAPRSIDGLVFSYELFDALPVHRFVRRADGGLGELWVELDDEGRFAWREGPLSHGHLPVRVGIEAADLAEAQIADLSPEWAPLYRELARRLRRGLLVTCDYGFERRRLLDPRVRSHGTLACYRSQRVHRDPFVDVGRQDLTAHVDFTALVEAGEAQGLETVVFTRQAPWLAACGLFEELVEAQLPTRLEAAALLDPEGMGHDLRVLVQSRGLDPAALVDLALLRR